MSLLYVCVRPQHAAAVAEYESFRLATELDEQHLAMHDLVRETLPGDTFDRYTGFVTGGSPFNVSDPTAAKTDVQRRVEADLERIAAKAARAETAALFTCYGIGIVTRMLGGEVSRAYPEDTGPVTVDLTADAQRDRLFAAVTTPFAALSAHKEGAGIPPPGATLLATNGGCPVQAYRVGDRLYTTQFHPEPTPRAFTHRMTVYRDDGYFDASDYDTIAAQVLAASITEPPKVLRAFAVAFGTQN